MEIKDTTNIGVLGAGTDHSLFGWYADCLKKTFCFTGRARPKEFWMFQLALGIVTIVLFLVVWILMYAFGRTAYLTGGEQGLNNSLGILMALYFVMLGFLILSYLPGLAVSVRRLHDINLSGWFMLLALVPGGNLALLVMVCLPGTIVPNQYGSNPKFHVQTTGDQILATASATYIHGLCAFSFFCPTCGFILWCSIRKTFHDISKKIIMWSTIGLAVTLVFCISIGLMISASGMQY